MKEGVRGNDASRGPSRFNRDSARFVYQTRIGGPSRQPPLV